MARRPSGPNENLDSKVFPAVDGHGTFCAALLEANRRHVKRRQAGSRGKAEAE
jgi:hypothetical protein